MNPAAETFETAEPSRFVWRAGDVSYLPANSPAVRFFLAPHKGQTVALRVTDELIAALEEGDGVVRMNAHYLAAYNRGAFGNKLLLEHLRELRAAGRDAVEGQISEHVDADERTAADGQRVMVVSSLDEDAICWRGPWDGERALGTTLSPDDVVLTEVTLAPRGSVPLESRRPGESWWCPRCQEWVRWEDEPHGWNPLHSADRPLLEER